MPSEPTASLSPPTAPHSPLPPALLPRSVNPGFITLVVPQNGNEAPLTRTNIFAGGSVIHEVGGHPMGQGRVVVLSGLEG